MPTLSEDLKIVISGDPKKFNKALDEVRANTKEMEAGLSAAAKISGAAFAALTGTVGGLIYAFREQELAENKTNALIKATGGAAGVSANEVFRLASSIQDVTTYGDELVIEAENILLGFNKIGTDVFPAMTSAARLLGKAMNDPAEGLAALTRAGIKFSTEQERVLKALAETGRVAEAQKLILEILKGRIGGLAEASAQGSGKLLQLKNAAGDVAEEMGRALVPTVAKLSGFLIPLFKNMAASEGFTKSAAAALLFATTLSGLVLGVSSIILGIVKAKNVITAAMTVMGGISLATVGWAVAIAGVLIAITDLALNWDKRLASIKAAWTAFIGYIKANPVDDLDLGMDYDTTTEASRENYRKAQEEKEKEHKARMIQINVAYLEAKKKLEDEYKNERMIAQESDHQAMELLEMNHRNKLLDLQNQLRAAQREANLSDNQIDAEQQVAYDVEIQNMANAKRAAELDSHRQAALERAKIQQKADLQYIKDREKYGVAFAKINKAINSEQVQGVANASSELVSLQQSTNSTLKAIGKAAAIADITIKTAQAAMNVYAGFSTIPIVGQALGIAAAAAVVAFGGERIAQVTKAADGGILTGGRAGRDSIPVMGMPGELIVPTKNYNEVVESVASRRLADRGVAQASGPGRIEEIVIGFKDDAFRIIARELRNRDLLHV